MKKNAETPIHQIGTQANSCRKRTEDLDRECERREREQNNQRIVYVKKKIALKLEKECRQYPKQSFSEIVNRCLNRYLEILMQNSQTARTLSSGNPNDG